MQEDFCRKEDGRNGQALPADRPSKCPKFYTSRTLGELNLHQIVCTFCQNLNRYKIMYSITYTLSVGFSICNMQYVSQLHNNYLSNTKSINIQLYK